MAARVKKRKKSPVTRSDTPVSRPVAEHRTGIGVLLEKYPRAAVSAMVLALVFAELTAGGVNAWRSLGAESPYAPRSQMIADSRTVARLSEHLRAASVSDSDAAIYRVGTLLGSSLNDNARLGQGGLSYFSSTDNGRLMRMLDAAGYNSDRLAAYYYKSFTPLMDSVLNVQYVAYSQDVGDPPYLVKAGHGEGYTLYRNTLALPRAFAVSDGLTRWNTSSDNPFDVQNNFVRLAVSDSDLTVYRTVKLHTATADSFGASYADGQVRFVKDGGRLLLNAVSGSRGHLYVYVDCEGASEIAVTVGERAQSGRIKQRGMATRHPSLLA